VIVVVQDCANDRHENAKTHKVEKRINTIIELHQQISGMFVCFFRKSSAYPVVGEKQINNHPADGDDDQNKSV